MNTTITDTSGPSLTTISFVLFEVILMFWICIGNGLVMFIFRRSTKLNSSASSVFIINLAVSDFLVGVFLALHIAMYLRYDMLRDVYVCVLRYSSLLLTQSASITGLVAMTYDRYYAIKWPLYYEIKMSAGRVTALISAAWCVALLLGFTVPMFWHNEVLITPTGFNCDLAIVLKEYFLSIALPCFLVCTGIVVYLYVVIFSIARRHAEEISKDAQLPSTSTRKDGLKNKMKLTKTGLIILGVFFGCWLPFCSIIFVQLVGGLHDNTLVTYARTLLSLVAVCNSGMNPIIYAFRVQAFKHELKSFLKVSRSRVDVIT